MVTQQINLRGVKTVKRFIYVDISEELVKL